ncbi:ATP-binding protein [uncultured Bacteroides sp.]|uniref:ATP-binding protein n=1 Tax=uncultured Bacteroides sp. TaxID=162156 RepID=UPI00260800E2|nr:ATP-binding protein [uncultured Bacteroides sp.]
MRYLNKVIFLNSAHVPYAEVKLDGNVHFIGTQGVGKSTLLRAVLFFYNADKLRLGIPKEKKNFDSFYLPFANSYIVYEVMRENGAYTVVVTKSMGRAAFRFIDAPYSKEWFVDGKNEVSADWSVIRTRVSESGASVSSLVTGYDMFRDIIFGNNRKPDLLQFRKYAIVESSRYQNIPRTIQNVFLNSKLDADFIKDTIIQSMDDNEFVVDLSYYRNQIETFEQEYSDVMLWIKQDRNGVVPVRKQADTVIKNYRMLLYAEKRIKDDRQHLNYSERVSRLRLPELEEQLLQIKEEAERFTRLLGEEKDKFDRERDKLVKLSGIIESDLKKIREKRKYYEQERIDEVISRVNRETSLKYELESLNKVYNELTSTYRDIISKYSLMEKSIDADFERFENEINKRVLSLENELGKRIAELTKKSNTQAEEIRSVYEEKLKTLADSKEQLLEEISNLKQQKTRVECTVHFKDEISDCEERLRNISSEEKDTAVKADRLKLECDRLRQKSEAETMIVEKEYDTKIDEALRCRKQLDAEIESLNVLINSSKGSFCEWLDKNRPGWQENIGKIADEQLILYNQNLSPELSTDGSNSFYGVKINLAEVQRELRSPEQLKAEFKAKSSERDEYTRKISLLNEEKTKRTEEIKNKYRKQISAISGEMQVLEIQLQQYPLQIKNIKAEQASWERKESEWKRNRLEEIETLIGGKEKERQKCCNNEDLLKQEREKRILQINEELRKAEKKERSAVEAEIQTVQNELSDRCTDADNRKKELHKLQNEELNGKGADTSAINSYKAKIDAIKSELDYISQKQSLVWNYEKDKRELFDREPELRDNKKNNEMHLDELEEKFALRKNKLTAQYETVKNSINEKSAERDAIKNDLCALENFRKDEGFCPPESYTHEELPTNKPCGKIVEELKSQIVSFGKDTENFKKSVNLFNSNLTARNTFSFPQSLSCDYMDFASNLCEFVENNKITEYQNRISERYVNIIRRISKETGELTQSESLINKTIKDINDDFIKRNFAGVIRSIELRPLQSNDKLMQLLIEIKNFNDENTFNMGEMDLFSQDSRENVNLKAVKYLNSFSKLLKDEPSRKSLVVSDTFNLEFRIIENDNDTGWVEKIANVGSDGTDILVKAMVNIMLINVFKEKVSRKFGDFKVHCMMDEIGKLHPNNVKGILEFANCRNILLINSSPTTYNVEDYKYTYLLSKDAKSNTRVVPLLTRK